MVSRRDLIPFFKKKGKVSVKSGIIELSELHNDYVVSGQTCEAMVSKSKMGKQFSEDVRDLCNIIPDVQGIYLWGRYKKNEPQNG